MGKRVRKTIFLGMVGMGIPGIVWADVGSLFMFASILHMVIGNLILGVVEGLILGWVFKLKKWKCVGLLILANYFSAWVGGILILQSIFSWIPMDINNGWRIIWVMIIVSYLMTLVMEWPFVGLCFWKTNRWVSRSIIGCILVQTVTYGFIVGWYSLAGDVSVFTRMKVVPMSNIPVPEDVRIYYISNKDGDVYTRTLKDSKERKIYKHDSKDTISRVFIRPSKDKVSEWDLMLRIETEEYRKPKLVTIETSFMIMKVNDTGDDETMKPDYNGGQTHWHAYQSYYNSEWKFRNNTWATNGFQAVDVNDQKSFSFGLECPFGTWYCRHLNVLSNDEVVFQLGNDQICLVEPNSRKIALITHGRGPVAVEEKYLRKNILKINK